MSTKLNLAFEDNHTYLAVQVSGVWTPDSMALAISDIAHAAHQRGFARVLIDARDLSGPGNDFNRFLAGQEIARTWLGLRCACLYPEELIDKFTENTAVNRGASILVLSDPEEALSWLIDGPTYPSTTLPNQP